MARLKINENEKDTTSVSTENSTETLEGLAVDELDNCINAYYDANTAKKKYETTAKENSNRIKEILNERNLTSYQGTKHSAKLSISTSVSFDTVKLLAIVKTLPAEYQDRLIDKVEYVNVDKLEREIIQGNLKADSFNDAKIETSVTKLYVK